MSIGCPTRTEAVESGRVGQEIGNAELSRGRAEPDRPQRGGRREPPQAAGRSDVAAGRRPCPHDPPSAGLLAGHLSPMTGVRHIGMTTWETDRLPQKWLPALARMDHLCVPSAHNLRGAARCARAHSSRNGGSASLSRDAAAAAARAPRRACEIPRHRAGRHCVLHDQHLVSAQTSRGAHRRLRAQLPAGRPGCAHRQDQPRSPVRRSRVSGARPQRKPRGGGDHRPRRR